MNSTHCVSLLSSLSLMANVLRNRDNDVLWFYAVVVKSDTFFSLTEDVWKSLGYRAIIHHRILSSFTYSISYENTFCFALLFN